MSDEKHPVRITEQDIRAAYRLILGREPESDAAVRAHMAQFTDIDALRTSFMESAEFRVLVHNISVETSGFVAETARSYATKPGHIETDVSPTILLQLLMRARDQWKSLGESEPHWSVLTSERFKRDRLSDDIEEEFYETGKGAANLLEIFEARGGVKLNRSVCVELGCGVGRITQFLADKFDQVIAVDISPGNLAICEQRMQKLGIDNVACKLVEHFDDFGKLPEYDVFFSMIALQHNAPPVQKFIMERIFEKGKPASGVLFQTATDLVNYTYSATDHLRRDSDIMDVHAIPQHVIFDLLSYQDFLLRAVMPDTWLGQPGSTTFFAIKRI